MTGARLAPIQVRQIAGIGRDGSEDVLVRDHACRSFSGG
jgi:hypothetical protein